ncbi:isochorismate synthase [Flexibacter flexilis DSM 6793]|uniref:isochorismate synthase n=1 Tax=Flexibacter flexilis DSM 6793 TaxID=927664 RepID=A0A1I1M9G3_9BACT|nr:chorismate-binding protein [Flexibacter flexilis]SFC82157.1 isochorismate synthase [Flexibacter flexilis DSM 6793]
MKSSPPSNLPQHLTRDWQSLWQSSLYMQIPVALWRLPNSTEKHFIAQRTGATKQCYPNLAELKSGFVVSPFHNPELQQTYFIESQIHLSSLRGCLQGEALLEAWISEINSTDTSGALLPQFTENQDFSNKNCRQKHLDLVTKGVQAIQAGAFEKVVLSRQKFIDLPENYDVLTLFEELSQAYPNAFISLFSLPSVGVWLSATPETLISTNENTHTFRTVALAGTQARHDKPLSQTSWTQKEIEEQALVCRYIVGCFKKIRLREYTETGPRTVPAGNLLHLRSDFEVDMLDTNFPTLGTTMLELLHPTSAVCGMPKIPATAFILENEGYNRGFYSGFLGPVNFEGQSEIFVHLRCMQLFEQKAVLYAGGGVTADSDPEREWQETELKCQTLGKVIEKTF